VAAYFLDTSTVVKRYVQEIGTLWVQALTDQTVGHFLFVARTTDVEMTAAIARRRRLGSLTAAQAGERPWDDKWTFDNRAKSRRTDVECVTANIPIATAESETSSEDLRQIPGVTPGLVTRLVSSYR
jgi:hypothetical protein